MARLLQAGRKALVPSSKTLIHSIPNHHRQIISKPISLLQSKHFATNKKIAKSPFDTNILRILRNEIDYQYDHTPPHQPPTEFKSFIVEDRPGEQYITMRGRYGDNEEIKIEATMFDGCLSIPRTGEDQIGEDLRLHISLLVDVMKGDGSHVLEFVCSAWSDCLEIQKVYVLQRDKMLARPYMGPDVRSLNINVEKALLKFLEERGIDDEISFFLHEYMMNKDKIELLKWLGKAKAFVEK